MIREFFGIFINEYKKVVSIIPRLSTALEYPGILWALFSGVVQDSLKRSTRGAISVYTTPSNGGFCYCLFHIAPVASFMGFFGIY